MAAPVTVIVAYDPKFYEHLPRLFPHNQDARSWFTSNEALAATTAFRNGTLQGAYLIVAARAVGLDAGPMSGFDNDLVDETFLRGYGWRSNFLVNLGHGDPAGVYPDPPASISRMRAGCSDPVQQQSASGVWRRPSPVLSLMDSGHLRNEWDLAQKRVHTVDHGGSHGGPRRCYSVQQPDELRGAPWILRGPPCQPFSNHKPIKVRQLAFAGWPAFGADGDGIRSSSRPLSQARLSTKSAAPRRLGRNSSRAARICGVSNAEESVSGQNVGLTDRVVVPRRCAS